MNGTFEFSICCIAISPFLFPAWLALILLPLFIMLLHTDRVCDVIKTINEKHNL